jgi:CRP-like cAMP-binding protein
MNPALYKLLKTLSYFENLDPQLPAMLANEAQRLDVEANQTVFLEGEETAALFFVEKGSLKAVKHSPTGREQILHFIEAGEPFNELSALAGMPNHSMVIALETSILWKIERKTIWTLIEKQPAMAQQVIQHLARRFQTLLLMLEDLSFRTIEARLARYLLSQADEGEIERAAWATQAELANRLGTVSDVLHRALRTLAKEKLILVERRKITILDRMGLEARAEFDK